MSLGQIRGRLAAATPGPWRWDEKFDPDKDGDTGLALTNESGVEIIGAYNYHCCAYRDDPNVDESSAEFIAHAPTDVRKLLAALDAVEALADKWESDFPSKASELRAAITTALKGES